MNNAIGFYILVRAWDYLLSRGDFSRGDGDAMGVISKAKDAIIWDDATDNSQIKLLLDCMRWKESMIPEKPIEALQEVI